MKFSVKDPAFPYFEPLKCSAYDLEIAVGGEVVSGAIAFDTIEGWVDRHQMDAAGRLMIMRSGDVAVERLRGVVTVSKKRSA